MLYRNYEILIGFWPLLVITSIVFLLEIWLQVYHRQKFNVFVRRLGIIAYTFILLSTLFFPITISDSRLTLTSAFEHISKIPLLPLIDGAFLSFVAAHKGDFSVLKTFLSAASYHLLILVPLAYFIRRENKTAASFNIWLSTVAFSIIAQIIRLLLNIFSGFFFFDVNINHVILNIIGSAFILTVMHFVRKNYSKNRGYNWKNRGPHNLAQTMAVKKFLNKKIKENSENYRGQKITRRTKWN